MRGGVVVPAVSAASSAESLRSLGRRGIRTVAVSEDPNAPAFASRFCDERVVVPSPDDDLVAYKDALASLARRDDICTILPMREADVYVLSRYSSAFDGHVTPVWPTLDVLTTVHDRVQMLQAALEAGVAAPETQLLDEVDDWDRRLVVKSRYSLLTDAYVESVPPTRAVDPGQTRYLRPGTEPDVRAIREEMGHVPIAQKYVSGTEHAFWALYDHGTPVVTCQRNRIRGYQYAGNASIYRATVADPRLEDAGRTLLDHLDWHGLASVQFIQDEDTNEFTLMEINPRMWLSLPAAVRAGVDFPYHCWRLANGDRQPVDEDYEVGLATHLLRGEVSYLNSVLRKDFEYVERPAFGRALLDVLVSLYTQPRFDLLDFHDPGPFFRDVLNRTVRTVGTDDGGSAETVEDEIREDEPPGELRTPAR